MATVCELLTEAEGRSVELKASQEEGSLTAVSLGNVGSNPAED